MLNSDEVGRLAKLFTDASDPSQAIADHRCVQRKVLLSEGHDTDLVFEECPAEQSTPMHGPAFIIGQPVDRSCLNGIGEQRFPQRPHRLHRYRRARVIGWRAMVSEDGELFCGRPIQTVPQFETFSRWARQGAEGIIPLMQAEQPSVCYRRPGREMHFPGVGLFLGMVEQGNYGSFIFRGLPQLLLAAELQLQADYLVVGERTPWMVNALAHLGLDRLPAFTAREVYGCLFDQLVVMDEIDSEAFLDELSLRRLRGFTDRCVALAGDAARAVPERLYVSRALSTNRVPGYRNLLNEADLEDLARARGFRIVYPEVHSLAEQCVLFHHARAIVGPSGSGMLNAVFAPDGARLADLEGFHHTVRQHAKLYSSSGKIYGFVFGETFPTHPSRRAFDNWQLAPALFSEALDVLLT